jgi:hypothetical protein
MTNLSQQLEDKKKGCRKLLITGTGTGKLSCGDYTDNNKNFYCDKCQEIIAILEQAIAEIKNIQSQQKTFKTSQNDRQGTVQTLVFGDEEVGVNSQFLRDNADTPQEKVSEVQFKALFPDIEKSSVVSNLLQKQRQEIFTILNKLEKKYSEIMTYVGEQPEWMKENKIRRDLLLEIKDKLNQPKTEETKHL